MLAKRLELIANLLQQNGSVEVTELSKLYGVTEKTIRQDLIKLEQLHIATRVHGGALPYGGKNDIFPIVERKTRYTKRKQEIARKAKTLINENDIIFLDSGTTTLELARLIDKRVIVITPDPFIQAELMNHEQVILYSTGGRLKREGGSCTLIGNDAVRMIRNYRAKKCFIGASALDYEHGLMVFSPDEVETKRAMIKASQEVIALVDSSKLEQTAFVSFADITEVTRIVTDADITQECAQQLENRNVQVYIAQD